MKKTALVVALIVSATMLFAAGVAETATVEGKIAVTDSIPMIQGNGKSWVLPPGAFYQVAWENGVKVGDSVKAEGYTRDCPADFAIKDAVMFMPTKVWINGKEIDLSKARHPMMGNGRARGMGRGDGSCGGSRDGCGRDGDGRRDRDRDRDGRGWW